MAADLASDFPAPEQAPAVTRLSSDPFEMFLEALLQVRLECHLWKAHFIHLAGHSLPEGTSADYRDVWDLMLDKWIPEYTPENYQHYAPLFENAIRDMRARFDRLIVVFSRVLPRDVRSRLERAMRQLEFAAASYQWIPAREHIENPSILFAARFKSVIRVLRLIARDADERLRAMVKEES
jgi:hypothetical protein